MLLFLIELLHYFSYRTFKYKTGEYINLTKEFILRSLDYLCCFIYKTINLAFID